MQMILFTYSCILMKTLENVNNRGHNNESVSHGQYLTISVLSVVTDKCVLCPFLIRYIFVLSVIYPLLVRQCPLVHRCLSVICPVRMRYSCVLCAPYTFRDDLQRHQDDFLHRINIFCIFSVRSASVSAIR